MIKINNNCFGVTICKRYYSLYSEEYFSKFNKKPGYDNNKGKISFNKGDNNRFTFDYKSSRNVENNNPRYKSFNRNSMNNDHTDDIIIEKSHYGRNSKNKSKLEKKNISNSIKLKGEGLFGVNPIDIALNSDNRSIYALYIQNTLIKSLQSTGSIDNVKIISLVSEVNSQNREKKEFQYLEETEDQNEDAEMNRYSDRKRTDTIIDIIMKCKRENIPIYSVDKKSLNELSKQNLHQGLVMDCSPLVLVTIDYLDRDMQSHVKTNGRKSRPPLWIVLDELWDSMNIGAIIRSSYYFGVDGIVVSDKNSSPITPVTSKISSGAVEDYSIYKTLSIPSFLQRSREKGWRVLGTSLSDDSKDISTVKLDEPTILVLGNEGFGLKQSILDKCNSVIKIVPNSKSSKVDSLNVSVSTAILVYSLLNTK
ncbi:hypothetical protein DLAC_05432 [Tieghemostelium lacteum]|uniref:rRNA methyltransferase 1, mitochondrial n=1 Tax=Tieghemostelium lacteum TaxID=361077 RepID=A0A151ZFV4_TIELA|nr:hypothetical protein DLAC_05432 [Tieghemostelium lacteum]|eukprot:KYQ92848.1 hypothetical protein DLAC_05432 [Tieghemostelium lacteum]